MVLSAILIGEIFTSGKGLWRGEKVGKEITREEWRKRVNLMERAKRDFFQEFNNIRKETCWNLPLFHRTFKKSKKVFRPNQGFKLFAFYLRYKFFFYHNNQLLDHSCFFCNSKTNNWIKLNTRWFGSEVLFAGFNVRLILFLSVVRN